MPVATVLKQPLFSSALERVRPSFNVILNQRWSGLRKPKQLQKKITKLAVSSGFYSDDWIVVVASELVSRWVNQVRDCWTPPNFGNA